MRYDADRHFARRSGSGVPLTGRRARGTDARVAVEVLALAGGHGEIVVHRARPWASITFTGARHELTLAFTGTEAIAAGEDLIADLPDHEFAIAGHLVADAAIRAVEHMTLPEPRLVVDIELLVLEEA